MSRTRAVMLLPVSLLGAVVLTSTSVSTATAASTEITPVGVLASSHDGNVPANALDGDLGTRWSAKGSGSWIRFDLGAKRDVESVAIAWYQGDSRKSTFSIESSTDGASWQVRTGKSLSSGSTADLQTIDVGASARYVRVTGYGNTENSWTSIAEFKVYTDGIASRPVTTGAPAPTGGAGASPGPTSGCTYPAQVLDLTNWKVTLPTGSSERPTEIKQPTLATTSHSDWFRTVNSCGAVRFRAPVNGVTTSGSSYPRSELREMSNGGTTNASWSAVSGTHTLIVKEAFTALPASKPHLVGAQIHDAKDDVSVFRLEGTKLYVTKGDDTHHKLVTDRYVLGTPFEAKFVVSGGRIKAYYNQVLQTTIATGFTGGYFKAGAYTQANCSNSSPCSSSNYGETEIYDIRVSHS